MNKILLAILPLTLVLSIAAMDHQSQTTRTADSHLGIFGGKRYVLSYQGETWRCPFCFYPYRSILRHIQSCLNRPLDLNWFVQLQSSYKDFTFTVDWRLMLPKPENPQELLGEYKCIYCDMRTFKHIIICRHMLSKHGEHLMPKFKPQVACELIPPCAMKRSQEACTTQEYEPRAKRIKSCPQPDFLDRSGLTKSNPVFLSGSNTDPQLPASAMDFQSKSDSSSESSDKVFERKKYILDERDGKYTCPFCPCTFPYPGILNHIKWCPRLPEDLHWFLQFQTSYNNYSFTINWHIQSNSPKNPREKLAEYRCLYCDAVARWHYKICEHMLSRHQEFLRLVVQPQTALSPITKPLALYEPQDSLLTQEYEKNADLFEQPIQSDLFENRTMDFQSQPTKAADEPEGSVLSGSTTDFPLPLSVVEDQSTSETSKTSSDSIFKEKRYTLYERDGKLICPFCSIAFSFCGILNHIKWCIQGPEDLHWFLQFQTSYKNYSLIVNWRLLPNNPREKACAYFCLYCNAVSPSLRGICIHMLNHHKECRTSLVPQIASNPLTMLPRPDEPQDSLSTQEYANNAELFEQPSQSNPFENRADEHEKQVSIALVLDGKIINIAAWNNLETGEWFYECKYQNCHYCSEPSDNIFNFISHICNHADKKLFTCECHAFETNNIIEFENHKKTVHHEGLSSEDFRELIKVRDQTLAERDKAESNSLLCDYF